MKRSVSVALLVSTTAFLAGCEQPVETYTYQSVAQCVAGGKFSADECQTRFIDAARQNAQVAPRYEDLDDCEDEHGKGMCQPPQPIVPGQPQSAGGSNVFMPFMMGYMMGGGSSSGHIASQPLYGKRSGGYYTAGGASVGRPNALGRSSVYASSVKSAPTRAPTVSRGGFGGARGGFSS